jgi:hypothetical protein
VIYGCEGDLHFNLPAKILEHVNVELFGVIDGNVSQGTVAIDDVLSEEFLDGCIDYVCDRLCLDPFCEVFHCYDSEAVIGMS